MVIAAIAVEAARRYFIVYKYCDEKFKAQYIPSTVLLVFVAVSPVLLRESVLSQIILVIPFVAIDVIIWMIVFRCEYLRGERQDDESSGKDENKKQWTVFLLSYLLLIGFAFGVSLWVNWTDAKLFEQKSPVEVFAEPTKVVIDGTDYMIFETSEGDILQRVEKKSLDLLKVQKGDCIKHLKTGTKTRFEIVTLRGEPYQK